MDPVEAALKSQELVERIRPILAGNDPGVVSGALADLLAMLLAGHMGPDAAEWREVLLQEHIKCVRELIPPNEQMIMEKMQAQGAG